jgi:hypothetical protein
MKFRFSDIQFSKNKFIILNLFVFFIFQTLFISLRTIIIGSEASNSMFDFLISSLPDIFALYIIIAVLFKNKEKLRYSFLTLYDKLILLYIITNVTLGTYLAHYLTISIYAIRMTYYPMLFYFVARIGFNSKEENSDHCAKYLVNWYFIVAIIGLIIYFFFPALDKFMTLKATGVEAVYYIKRIGSLYWSPVIFGAFATFGGIYTYLKITEKETIPRYIIFAVFWCCIFLTVSRGANITFYLGWIILTLFFKKYRCFLKTLIVIIFVFFTLWIYDHEMYKVLFFIGDSTVSTLTLTDEYSRVDLWRSALGDFFRNPMGYGLGKAGHIAVRFFGRFSNEAAVFSTDGWYLKLANETGIWGLFSYAVIFLTFFISSIKFLKKNKNTFFTFIFVFFIMIAAQNFVSNILDFYSFSCLYWLLIGLSQNIRINGRSEKC